MGERRYTADETQDYYPDPDDVPVNPRRFCFEHGWDECSGEAIDCDVIEEAA